MRVPQLRRADNSAGRSEPWIYSGPFYQRISLLIGEGIYYKNRRLSPAKEKDNAKNDSFKIDSAAGVCSVGSSIGNQYGKGQQAGNNYEDRRSRSGRDGRLRYQWRRRNRRLVLSQALHSCAVSRFYAQGCESDEGHRLAFTVTDFSRST